MIRRLVQTSVVLFAVFVLIQFVPYRVTNPDLRDEPDWDSPATRELAVRACFNCHSNETELLWFERAAPGSWWLNNHVREARTKLNFSEWHVSAGDEADDAPDEVSDGEMPPSNYTWFGLHGEANLSPAEVAALVEGLERTIEADPPVEADD